jgi:hypothetical protein
VGSEPWADRFWSFVAVLLPRRLVYFCSARMFEHAIGGQWSSETTPSVSMGVCMERWEIPWEDPLKYDPLKVDDGIYLPRRPKSDEPK